MTAESGQNLRKRIWPSVWQLLADLLTFVCLLTTGGLILCFVYGPKTGMEALVLIIPWMICVLVNVVVVLPAVVCAVLSRRHLRNLWIYLYFSAFFFIHGAYFVSVNKIDVQVAKLYESHVYGDEMELNRTLRRLSIQNHSNQALDAGMVERVKELVAGGADVNRNVPGEKRTPILYACAAGEPQIVELLIDRGADLQVPQGYIVSPLTEALQRGHTQVVALLLSKGADPNIKNYAGQTPLMIAAKGGDSVSGKHLLDAGADPGARHSSGSALARAVGSGDTDAVRWLLEAGADPSERVFGGKSLLYVAIEKKHRPIAALLQSYLPAGQPGRPAAGNSQDSLFRALKKRDLATFKSLLEMGVSPDERDAGGRTLLHRLIPNHHPDLRYLSSPMEIATLLIVHGADVNATDGSGVTPLMRAARSGESQIAVLLVENGAQVDARTGDGQTALMFAAYKHHREVAAVLLRTGADPNARTRRKMNNNYPLHAAVRSGDPQTLKMVLDAGALIDEHNRDKGDLFQHAAKSPEMVKYLVESGVNFNRPDSMDRYPLTQVLTYGTAESARILLDAGARLDVRGDGGKTPFLLTARNGHAELLPLFFDQSEPLRIDGALQRRALNVAVEFGQEEMVRTLLDRGVPGTLAEAEQIMARSRALRKAPQKKESIRRIFQSSAQ